MILLTLFFGCQTNPWSAGFSFEGGGRCSRPCRAWSQLWLPNSGLQPLLCVSELTYPYVASDSPSSWWWQSWQFLWRVSSRLFWGVISGGPTQSSLLQSCFNNFVSAWFTVLNQCFLFLAQIQLMNRILSTILCQEIWKLKWMDNFPENINYLNEPTKMKTWIDSNNTTEKIIKTASSFPTLYKAARPQQFYGLVFQLEITLVYHVDCSGKRKNRELLNSVNIVYNLGTKTG